MLVEGKEDVVAVDVGEGVMLEAGLSVPSGAGGLVIFSHASASSRTSPRNNFVSGVLHRNNLATLLIDLLTSDEDVDYRTRFDIGLLTRRLEAVTRWAACHKDAAGLNMGYFGASTGAAAAMKASVAMGPLIGAVVVRGGRTDLADDVMAMVNAPTLFIAGGGDDVILKLNRGSLKLLTVDKELSVIPGATHLFEESGALEEVAALSAAWFRKYIGDGR